MNIDTTKTTQTTEPAIGFIPCYRLPFLSLFHADCMEIMKQYPDKYFDLAIVDPPYGIDINNQSQGKGGGVARKIDYTKKNWDKSAPEIIYFNELRRVSKNQIVWGANHFISRLPFDSSCWIVWDKDNGETDFADCELAWTSFKTAVRRFKWTWAGMRQQNMKNKEERIHPTQKPIALYEWILQNYASEGNLILDTHFGSGSIALAIYKVNRLDKMNLHLTACEIDKEYIDKAIKRISESIKQGTLSF
jgi:site-specific DNA-methyltransferase (adenine-specific)